jgi:hypothetical protein
VSRSPYQNEREACAAARAVIPPEPGWSILSQSQLAELLHRALAEAGVETSDFEDRTGWWLSGWEDYTIAIIARWVTDAYKAGKAAGPDGAATEWGVRIAIGTPAEVACPGEKQARNSVVLLRRDHPEFGAVLVTRTSGGRWRLADEPATGTKGEG